MVSDKVSKARWLEANEQELKVLESAEYIQEWIRVRRLDWTNLLNLLKNEIVFDGSKRVLDIGGGPASIFLALSEGEKYTVEPNLDCLFQLHPFIKEIEEYKDVIFISRPIEDVVIDKQFDLIFIINVLDHVGATKPVVDKISELLAPTGTLVVLVDCYFDSVVRNIIKIFDIDLPHPHHWVVKDVMKLFSNYKLKKQDAEIYRIFQPWTFQTEKKIEIWRIDKLLARARLNVSKAGKSGDLFFFVKYILCYGIALPVDSFRRRVKPFTPFKRLHLFIFQKF